MNVDLKHTFARIKPVCDVVMMTPSPESIAQFSARVSELNKEAVQELQQYLLFPFITHIKSTEIEKKYELQWQIIDGIKVVLERVTVINFEMCIKIETGLLSLVFDNSKSGMIAAVPEELKHSVMKCLTVLMLHINHDVRTRMLRTQVPLIAQAVFVSVHIAKLEKLRALRLAAIDSVLAHTACHRQLTNAAGHICDVPLETLVVDLLASILPGVSAALQDVAVGAGQPGHAVVAGAINAIHRIICITMNDKYLAKQPAITAEDFAKMIKDKRKPNSEVSNKDKKPKELLKRSAEWFAMAGEKLQLISKSLSSLVTHEHMRVRRELSVYCSRMLSECRGTMRPSVPICLDVLIALSKDEYGDVAVSSANAVKAYFAAAEDRQHAMDSLCESFFATLTSLPRILNNIDSSRKLAALNLVHGYMEVLCDDARPQRLTVALSSEDNVQRLVAALAQAAAVRAGLALLARRAAADVTSPPVTSSPWCTPRHLEGAGARRLALAAALLGGSECGALMLDRLPPRTPEALVLTNALASAPIAPPALARRVIDAYIDESVWYLPLEVGSGEAPLTSQDTLDPSVYNPRAWTKDSVPGLFEGATETRITGISYSVPRVRRRDPDYCATLAEAQRNMVMACLLTEGVGLMARRLERDYEPYLLKTLCLLLERVGSTYEMLHLAGVKAINDVAAACGHASVGDLIRENADYFTNQISVRLKKAWNTQSALQILSVVMEYSDATILDCLYGIVEDVLVQSLDKYHEKNLHAYLQVFLTFITCIKKWFPAETAGQKKTSGQEIDILRDLMEYVGKTEEVDKLLEGKEGSEAGKSAEELYMEDQNRREEEVLDYDDKVTEEKPPLPRHIPVAATILKRCLNFLSSRNAEEAILALQVLDRGLPILQGHEDELLPLVHLTWAPLVARFESAEPPVLRHAFQLLVTLAALAKDFIRHRAITDALPHMYVFLHKSARDSHLKDKGSAYRSSPPFRLQLAALEAMETLVPDLGIEGDRLEDAMACVTDYLSKKQPKPLQELAVKFFKAMLVYDYGAAWYQLRALAANECVLAPPRARLPLAPVAGAPLRPRGDLRHNVALAFHGFQPHG